MIEYSTELHDCCISFLEKDEAVKLLSVMDTVSYEAGQQVFQKGAPADCLYFLYTGRIAVQNKTGFGEKMQVVALLDPGAPVGEKGLLGECVRGASLTAVKDSVLLSLSTNAFESLVVEAPALAIKVLRWLLNRVSLRLEKNSERLAQVL